MVELWRAYRSSPNEQLRRQLIEEFAPLAKYVVDRIHFQPTGSISYDDLIGQAIIGLIEAIDRYDPARGVKFNTFAYYRIRGSVMDMLRELDWVPRALRSRFNEVVSTISLLSVELGRQPTDDEIARRMGVSLQEYADLAVEVGGQALVSLDEMTGGPDGDGSFTIADAISDENAVLPENYTESQDQRRVLAESIESLPEKERLVISLYYHDGLTMKEIGKVIGVTESRVCQLHSKAVIRLRAMMQNEIVV